MGRKLQGTEKKVVIGLRVQPTDLKLIIEKFGTKEKMWAAVVAKLKKDGK